ncbi:MAG: 50S ribosomal protein L13 [bacterium]|nr:50S ribosomal protein L13 [bacterium]
MQYTIDAQSKPFGRIASEVASILQGKKKASYDPRLAGSDKVVIKNLSKIAITGNKAKGRVYYRHTGYMGHVREATFEEAFGKNAQKVFREAVRHMLPKNRLAVIRLKNLSFVEEEAK